MIQRASNVQDIEKVNHRIFCDFHIEDKEHFLRIKEDIFGICQCSLFYYDKPDSQRDAGDLEFDVAKANLYLLIVSSNTLFDENFDRRPFEYALKNNIPILPIVVENGIEACFNEKFGNIQCLNTCLELVDHTAVPYIKKMQNFLNQNFFPAFDVEKIRGAFDSTIFLSYRKKDREYAQKLIEAIHTSDVLKNVAVWYDEFLVPGEDFDAGIRSELEESQLFILMITPNILEAENYIRKIEYPLAVELEKTIVPIVSVDTDENELGKAFPDIAELLYASDSEVLNEYIIKTLEKKGIILTKRSFERDLYIGFAFLRGIRVEKNIDTAIKMITNAAEGNVTGAKKTLATIFKYGDGCASDIDKSAFWQGEYIAQLLLEFESEPIKEKAEAVIDGYKELSNIYVCGGKIHEAKNALLQIVDFLKSDYFSDDQFANTKSADVYEAIALLHIGRGEYEIARREGFLEKAIELRNEEFNKSQEAFLELINAYLLKAECQFETDDVIGLKTTVKVELKTLRELLLVFSSKTVEVEPLQKLMKIVGCLCSIGKYMNHLDMMNEAFVFIGEAVNLSRAVNKKYGLFSTNWLHYTALRIDGDQHIKFNVENHLKQAETAYEEAYDVAVDLYEQSKTSETQLGVAESILNICRAKNKLGKQDEVIEKLKSALELYGELSKKVHTLLLRHRTYKAYYFAAEIYVDMKESQRALEIIDRGLSINEEILRESTLSVYKLEMAEALKLKAELLKKEWDFDGSLECLEKRHSLVRSGAYKNKHIYLIAESFETLIAAHKSAGDFQKAKALSVKLAEFKKQYEIAFNGSLHLYK